MTVQSGSTPAEDKKTEPSLSPQAARSSTRDYAVVKALLGGVQTRFFLSTAHLFTFADATRTYDIVLDGGQI